MSLGGVSQGGVSLGGVNWGADGCGSGKQGQASLRGAESGCFWPWLQATTPPGMEWPGRRDTENFNLDLFHLKCWLHVQVHKRLLVFLKRDFKQVPCIP